LTIGRGLEQWLLNTAAGRVEAHLVAAAEQALSAST
jgi:hypothetical protein